MTTIRKDKRPRLLGPAILLIFFGVVLGIYFSAGNDKTGPAYAEQGENPVLKSILQRGLVQQFSEELRQIAAFVMPAVVSIRAEGSAKRPAFHDWDDWFHFFRPPQQEWKTQSLGSGFIAAKQGHILTNNHVIEGAGKIYVTLSDKTTYDAKIIGGDPKTDVAVLKISGSKFPVVVLGDSSKVQVGDFVLAIGSPFGLSGTVTSGIISHLGRAIRDPERNTGPGGGRYTDFIQIDAAINPGNSGGPLVNDRGEVIGINTMIFTSGRSRQNAGVGFSVPINVAHSVMRSFVKYGRVVRGHLGVIIRDLSPDLAEALGLEAGTKGALITDITEGGPADKAGLREEDVVVRFDDKEVGSVARLRSLVGSTEADRRVDVLVIRKGGKRKFSVKIGELKEGNQQARRRPSQAPDEGPAEANLGLQVVTLTRELANRYDLRVSEGVLVQDVRPGSQAAQKGLEPGVVILEANNKTIKNVEDLRRAMKNLGPEGKLKLRLQRGAYKDLVVLRIGK